MSISVETARDILLSAFETMVVRMDTETLTAPDEETAVKEINWIMTELSVDGVDLGFTLLDKISDPITINRGLMRSLVSLLAESLWPKYRSIPRTDSIITGARRAKEMMYKVGVTIGATEYPSTLPRGSGNTYPGGGTNDYTFYDNLEATILTETNGSISLEDSTNDD
jgi:hypothetical protein